MVTRIVPAMRNIEALPLVPECLVMTVTGSKA